MYCVRIKTEVSICATAADMTRLRVRRVVVMQKQGFINKDHKQKSAKESAFTRSHTA